MGVVATADRLPVVLVRRLAHRCPFLDHARLCGHDAKCVSLVGSPVAGSRFIGCRLPKAVFRHQIGWPHDLQLPRTFSV